MWILFVSCMGIDSIFTRIKFKIVVDASVVCLCVCAFYIQSSSLFTGTDRKTFFADILPFKTFPLRVENYSAYQNLIQDLDHLTHDGSSVTILSSSGVLNEEIIDSLSHHALAAGVPEAIVLDTDRNDLKDNALWHTDVTFSPTPPLGAVLAARLLPPSGGDTLWASATAAWRALSPRSFSQRGTQRRGGDNA